MNDRKKKEKEAKDATKTCDTRIHKDQRQPMLHIRSDLSTLTVCTVCVERVRSLIQANISISPSSSRIVCFYLNPKNLFLPSSIRFFPSRRRRCRYDTLPSSILMLMVTTITMMAVVVIVRHTLSYRLTEGESPEKSGLHQRQLWQWLWQPQDREKFKR